MGFLDDLKNNDTGTGPAGRSDEGNAEFVAAAQPAMRALHEYLQQLANHLNNATADQAFAYDIEGYGSLSALKQNKFVVSVDDENLIQTCVLRYCCSRPLGVEFYQPNKEAGERQQQYLWKHKLRFSSRKMTDERWLFELESYVPVTFEFIVNAGRQIIQLKVTNQDSLGTVGYSYHTDDINPLYLDELAKYLMHKRSRFHELSGDVVPDDTLAKLRQQVEQRKLEREAELGASEKRVKPKGNGKGLFKGLFKR